MIYKISSKNKEIEGEISIVSSKSESNRVLIIKAIAESIYKDNSLKDNIFNIDNLSNSNDTRVLQKALSEIQIYQNNNSLKDSHLTVNIEDCGTAMRFLTAFLAVSKGKFILTGTDRMKQRPVGILADALIQLGAKISYQENQGFLPLLIEGLDLINTNLTGNKQETTGKSIEVDADVSSQFVSALLLIAPVFSDGLTIVLKNKTVSKHYISMTLDIMSHFGIRYDWTANTIKIHHQTYKVTKFTVNGDWSAASYWYELLALSNKGKLKINDIVKNGLQGDEYVAELFEKFGVNTKYEQNHIILNRTNNKINDFEFDFTDNPDLAQTFAVLCAVKNVRAELKGLESLTIKECDRIKAVVFELTKFGFNIKSNKNQSIIIKPVRKLLEVNPVIHTYKDHRMAMAFAPMAVCFGEVYIDNPLVVNKSYPEFWKQLGSLNFNVKELNDFKI